MSPATMLERVDTTPLDRAFLDPDTGRLRALFPAASFLAYPEGHRRLWCHERARYCLPTTELVHLLRHQIAGRSAIEIGSGNGDLGYMLGIQETDSYIQQSFELKLHYAMSGQPPTNPPPSVELIDALPAVMKYRPQVVIAAWFTRKFEVGKDRDGVSQASIYGEREEKILERCETYIHVGNRHVHGQKTLLKKRFTEIVFNGHLSRSGDQNANVVWIWQNKKK